MLNAVWFPLNKSVPDITCIRSVTNSSQPHFFPPHPNFEPANAVEKLESAKLSVQKTLPWWVGDAFSVFQSAATEDSLQQR